MHKRFIMIRILFFSLFIAVALVGNISNAKAQEMKKVFENEQSYPGISKVEVEGLFCKIIIMPSEDGVTSITSQMEAMESHDEYKINSAVADGEVKMTVEVPKVNFASHAGEIVIKAAPNLEVAITNTSGYIEFSNLKQTVLSASTTSGKITGNNSDGKISVSSKSGNITIDNLKGDITTSSSSGAQFAGNLEGNISLDSPDGAITVDNVKGNLKIATIAGNQTLTNIEGDINLRGSSGALKISNAQANITIETLNGSVNLFGTTGVYNISTTKGLIAGSQVKFTDSSSFTTTEGRIKIKLMHKKEDLSFVLRSDKGALIAVGTSKMKKLNVGNGPIVITGTSKTGGQNYFL